MVGDTIVSDGLDDGHVLLFDKSVLQETQMIAWYRFGCFESIIGSASLVTGVMPSSERTCVFPSALKRRHWRCEDVADPSHGPDHLG